MAIPLANKKKSFDKRLIIALSGGYIAIFGTLVFALKPGMPTTDLTLRSLYVVPVITAFIACFWASRKTTAYRRLWRLMATGMFFWMIGEIIFVSYVAKYELIARVPSPSIADLFSIAYVPIVLGVMLSLGRIRRPFDSEKKQFLANVSMLAIAAFLLCYKFLLIPEWYSNPSMSMAQRMYAIGYPLLDWVIFISLLLTTHRFLEGRIEGWLFLLIAAFSLAIIADITFYLFDNERNPFTTWAMTATAMLIALSAIDEVTGALIGTINRPYAKAKGISNAQVLSQSPWRTLLIPFIATMVIPLVWIAYSIHGQPGEAIVLGSVSVLVLLVLLYRNHLLFSDNAILLTKALHDSLTGLNNHRYFQEVLSKTVLKAEKIKKPISLLVLDIDSFSEFNNIYGHVVGDKVLTIIAKAISSKIREADEACRLSGDEFAVILPKTNEARALSIAENLKKIIDMTLTGMFPGKGITISIGISTYPTLAKDKDELLHTADGALYWGKLHGKNNVLLYNPKIVHSLSAEERAKKVEEAALVDMVRSLAKAVDARDPYTQLHSQGVSDLAKRLAKHMGLDEKTISRIEIAGILHDVGKIGIPDHILNKPGRLSDEELVIIKTHPELSAQIIKSTSLKDIIPAVRAHHERWDGNGYPSGIKGEVIPFEARILAIADTFDAMTTDRPYRKALSITDALSEIKRCAGTQFDPKLVEHFLAMYAFNDNNACAPSHREKQVDVNYNLAAGS